MNIDMLLSVKCIMDGVWFLILCDKVSRNNGLSMMTNCLVIHPSLSAGLVFSDMLMLMWNGDNSHWGRNYIIYHLATTSNIARTAICWFMICISIMF